MLCKRWYLSWHKHFYVRLNPYSVNQVMQINQFCMHVIGTTFFLLSVSLPSFCGVYITRRNNFQLKNLPELQRKLKGVQMENEFIIWFPSPAAESACSVRVLLARGCKCTISPAYHFNADATRSFRSGALVYCFFSSNSSSHIISRV